MSKQSITNLANVISGGARQNKFRVRINTPTMSFFSGILNRLTGGQTSTLSSDSITLLAKASLIPEKSISVVDVWHRGLKYHIRGKASFDSSWTVTFYNDQDLKMRAMFEEWMYEIDRYDSVLAETSFINNYLGIGALNAGYMTNMYIDQLSHKGDLVASYELFHAFPTNISAQKYDSSEQHVASEFTVTFTYDYWTRVNENGVFSGILNFINS